MFKPRNQVKGADGTAARSLYQSLGLMVAVALLIRLIAVWLLYEEQLSPHQDYFDFGWEVGRVARAVVLGQGFSAPLVLPTGPTAILPPVYVYLLAGVFQVFGIYTAGSAIAILSLNSLFSALTCLPVFSLARKTLGPAVAVRAGWTWALFPYAVFCATTQVWSESLSAFLLSLIFLLALRLEQGARRRAWWGTGLLTGLAALVNPAVLSVLFALLVWVCFRLRQRRVKWVGPLGVALFALVMAVLPWGARNYLVFGRLMPLRDNFWLEVRIGNTGDTSDVDPEWAHPSRPGSELEEFRRLGELNYMAEKRRQAVEFIATRPGTFLWLTIRRAVFVWTGFWSLSPGYLALEPMEPANIVFCTTLTVLMAVGLRAAWRDRKAAAIPYALFLLSFPLVYYLTHPTLNYRHPIDPAIVVLAVYGAITLFSRVRL